jgi:Flp pilus assembly protein TadG
MHFKFTGLAAVVKSFVQHVARARRGNVAMIFAIVLVPVLITGGAGIDLARAMAVRTKLYAAVDAAALAVASKNGITQTQANTLAQQYFNANYKLNSSFGTPEAVTVNLVGQSVTVSTQSDMPTTLMGIAGFQNVNLTASSNVVWGQTRIWVGLALDNTGSMCQTDTNPNAGSPCANPPSNSKIAALKTATHTLLNKFQSVAANPGDVKVSLIPFTKDVNAGASSYGQSWIDWTDWDNTTGASNGTCTINGVANASYTTKSACLAAPAGTCSVSGFSGSQTSCSNAGSCTISGYTTQSSCTAATTGTCSIGNYTSQNSCQNNYINVCSISGYSTQNSCQSAYVNVCSISGYTTQSSCTNAYVNVCSNPGQTTQSTCINNKACSNASYTGQSSCQNAGFTWAKGTWNKVYGVWSKQYGVWSKQYGVWSTVNGVWTSTPGTWTVNTIVWTPNHAAWNGCITDRGLTGGPSTPAYDTLNSTPGASPESKFPAEQFSSCPVAVTGLSYDWTTLNATVDTMVAAGNTNQTIGLAWAWQSMTTGAPFSAPSLPTNTSRYIIILSDGENTENRWSSTRSTIDARMNTLCTNAKNDGVVIWSVFVNIAGGAGNAQSMKDCATGGANGGHYIEVTSSGGIGTAFDVISQQITNLRVAQ